MQVRMVMPIPMDDDFQFAVRVYNGAWMTWMPIDLYDNIERWAWTESQGNAFSFPMAFEEGLFMHSPALYESVVRDIS
jgi:hypothetical protein